MKDIKYPEEHKYDHWDRLLAQMKSDRRFIDDYFNKRLEEIKENALNTGKNQEPDLE